MILKQEIESLLLKACPSFKSIYDVSEHKELDLQYPLADDFAHHLLTLFKKRETSEFPAIAEMIECLHTEGDAYTKEFASIGILESIQNVWSNNAVDPEAFRPFLLPLSEKYWQSLNDFWEQKVPYVGYGIKQTTARNRTAIIKNSFLFLLSLLAVAIISFKYFEYRFYLSAVPSEFGVYRILYRQENAWGFGPGGNETGIRVYELPDRTYQIIQQQGLEYLNSLPSAKIGRVRGQYEWRGKYNNWLETPINVTRHWTDYMSLPEDADYSKEVPSISNYMNAYGFGLRIDPEIRNLADDSLKSPGNYYAYGRIGVIIVIPQKKRVIYAYNG